MIAGDAAQGHDCASALVTHCADPLLGHALVKVSRAANEQQGEAQGGADAEAHAGTRTACTQLSMQAGSCVPGWLQMMRSCQFAIGCKEQACGERLGCELTHEHAAAGPVGQFGCKLACCLQTGGNIAVSPKLLSNNIAGGGGLRNQVLAALRPTLLVQPRTRDNLLARVTEATMVVQHQQPDQPLATQDSKGLKLFVDEHTVVALLASMAVKITSMTLFETAVGNTSHAAAPSHIKYKSALHRIICLSSALGAWLDQYYTGCKQQSLLLSQSNTIRHPPQVRSKNAGNPCTHVAASTAAREA